MIGQGVAMDPCNHSVLYWGNTPYDATYGGLFKTTNAGGSWTRIGLVDATQMVDMPLKIRVDPSNSQHLFVGDGVRGATQGLWESTDGGAHFVKPAGWIKAGQDIGAYIDDVYDIAIDPSDFKHMLVTSHGPWAWDSAAYGRAAGVMETKDGGKTWIAHKPILSWGTGHAIYFLYDPQKGIGNNQTWLLATQADGQWRTSDAGQNWTRVAPQDIAHGGGTHYYSKTGVLYMAATPRILRSTDNGLSFTEVGDSIGYRAVWGDGTYLYIGQAGGHGPQPFSRSPEADGITWTPFGQSIDDNGPYEMLFDDVNKLLYASNWSQGLWVYKP